MAKLLTTNYKLDLAKRFIESISDTANNTAYYLYVSNHVDTEDVSELIETNDQKTNKLYNSMLFGKKIKPSDAKIVIKNVPYQENKVFQMYEHDVELADKDFYCIVDEDSYFHVYKCLDNNFGAKSVIAPDISYFTSTDNYVSRLNDGYLWKYMYSVSSVTASKFTVSGYFPLQANTTVSDDAINGSIDVIKIIDGGKGYNNYTNGTFADIDLRINGNQKRYKIGKNAANGYLNDCLLYITTGTGAGQYANIVTYFSNESGNFVDIDREFDTPPSNQTQYEINPSVKIVSNGRETKVAVARALVNSYSSNSIYRIEMLEKGENYEYASAYISANVNVGIERTADLKLIYSPYGGHGKDAEKELYASRACVSVKISNTENNTIPATNNYKEIGIIKDPLFSQSTLKISDSSSSFISGETIYKFDPFRVATNATIVELTSNVSVTEADFQSQLQVGQTLYLKGPNQSDHQLVVVNSVINSTTFSTKSNTNFSCTNGYIYFANTSSNAKVLYQTDNETVIVNAVSGVISSTDNIIGSRSGCKATISSIQRSGVTKTFDTFVQMYKYDGTKNSGTFAQDEVLYQGNSLNTSTANATLHSFTLDGTNITFYASNQKGEFDLINPVFGSGDGVCSISDVTPPELIYGSGEPIYINTIEPITRQTDQNEQFKIVFEF